jgi:hypothetical protein
VILARLASWKVNMVYIVHFHENLNGLFDLKLGLALWVKLGLALWLKFGLRLKSDGMTLWLCQLVTSLQNCLQNKIHNEIR